MRNYFLLFLLLICGLIIGCGRKADDSRGRNHTAPESIPFDFPDLQPPVFKDQTFDIRDYGAKQGEDTTFLNTEAIRSAIDACNNKGGGKVLIPSGVWLTGPVHLKSNVNLHLEEGAELRFSQNFDDYLPVVLIKRVHLCYNYSPPIYAINCENIAVTGKGIVNGQGQVWWPWKKRQPGMIELFEMGKSGVPVEERVFGTEEAGVRPPFIQFIDCKNVLLQGITVKDGPSWNINPAFCENLIIREIYLTAHGPNNDGINPDGCRNVLIEDCIIDAGDDALTMKSGRDEEAWETGRALENVVIRGCKVKKGHGGFVIGSDMSGGVRNVLVEDCYFNGTGNGLRFKSRTGRGGIVENIWIRNITMEKIRGYAVTFNLLYNAEPIERDMNYLQRHDELVHAPIFRNIHIENISCESAKTAMRLIGLPGEYLSKLHFENIIIKAKNGVISDDVHDLHFDNVKIISLSE